MRELLRQRRWAVFTAFVLCMVILTGFLAHWQWSRYRLRQGQNAELDAAIAAPSAPITDLLTARTADAVTPLPERLQWRSVTAKGQFEDDRTVLVRRRPLNGQLGFWVVTPLITDSGTLLVNRGWVAAEGRNAVATPTVPAAPSGDVVVIGRLRPAESSRQADQPPAGQAWAADPVRLIQPASVRRFNAYIELTSSTPADPAQLAALPLPEHKGANNFSYTFQWMFFGLVALFGWWRLLRAQAEEGRPAPAPDTD